MDGYTEILLAHQTVLNRLFEIQSLDPLIDAIHVFEPMLDCVTQLREVYSDYFLDLADRRHVLKMTKMTDARFMPITDVCTLSAELRICTDGDQIQTMFRPGRMDIVPITLQDLTDVPLHYCEFFVTALHKFLIKLNTPASSIALRKVVLSFMRVIYDLQAKFTERQSRMEGYKTMLQYRDRFIWKDQKIVSRPLYPCMFELMFLDYRT